MASEAVDSFIRAGPIGLQLNQHPQISDFSRSVYYDSKLNKMKRSEVSPISREKITGLHQLELQKYKATSPKTRFYDETSKTDQSQSPISSKNTLKIKQVQDF